jgi:hypothetical protein
MALNAALIIMQLVGDQDGEAGQPGDLVLSVRRTRMFKRS